MKIATWNVNSIRARMERLLAFLEREKPDVACLQETKVVDAAFPVAQLEERGWKVAFHGQKTYNGVAIVSRGELTEVERGFCDGEEDPESRSISATVGGVRLLCLYVPNGQEVGSPKFTYKLRWLHRLRLFLDRCYTPDQPLVVCGDFNVAPEDRDVWDPELWRGRVLFSEEEKAALRDVGAFGLVDALRLKNQDAGVYTWWDYRMGAFHRGWGLRIDHFLVTKPVAERVTGVTVLRDERKGKEPSDHAPVIAEIDTTGLSSS